MSTKKLQIIGSMNADTLDGKHANEFASATDVETLNIKVGDTPVSEQIDAAIAEAIPTVTTSDNGKFLRVIDGAWAASSIPNAEEAEF